MDTLKMCGGTADNWKEWINLASHYEYKLSSVEDPEGSSVMKRPTSRR